MSNQENGKYSRYFRGDLIDVIVYKGGRRTGSWGKIQKYSKISNCKNHVEERRGTNVPRAHVHCHYQNLTAE